MWGNHPKEHWDGVLAKVNRTSPCFNIATIVLASFG